MRLYGIFDQNYKLLRYSTDPQLGETYEYTDPTTKQRVLINEVCISNIEVSDDYIGKYYRAETDSFSETPN
jgi:hypothetical protein